ncbi:MAG TPA: 4-hydroxy-tetrahydrodipicolinate reductase [Clostridiales bacterium]|nr:4-hydroxy-tetrahydrodipicolinate reductase [Clostridiales bacterium]
MALRIFLSGCCGRMGRVIADIAACSSDLEIVAGSDLVSAPGIPFPVYADPRSCPVEFDVLIDFSNPAALPAIYDLIRQRRCPAVICTTGLDENLENQLKALSTEAAIFKSANMSLGINLMISLARQAARLLYPEFDIEIIEAHHNQKIDAPSGTALMIANKINQELDHQLEFVYDRSQARQKRGKAELGIHAVRGGSIVGEHTVLFAGQDEVFSMHHSATSRNVFARGAIAAARFLAGKPAGLYDMSDLIG